jgi:hypothetical protein
MWSLIGNVPQYLISQATLFRSVGFRPFPSIERNMTGRSLVLSVGGMLKSLRLFSKLLHFREFLFDPRNQFKFMKSMVTESVLPDIEVKDFPAL